MIPTTSFFLLLLLIITFPHAHAGVTTATAEMLPDGEIVIDEQIILDDNSVLDVSENVQLVETENKIIGGKTVVLKQGYKFNTNQGNDIILENTQLPTVEVQIPDNTIVSASTEWDGKITPPKSITTSGIVAPGFSTPTTSIQIGSSEVILVFDEVVTILLEGTIGQTAYKTPDSNTWILISNCLGTYDSPTDPGSDECSITNGTDTKILTYHFTEFTGLTETVVTTTTTETTTTSSGYGPTGVGPGSSGSRGGSALSFYQQSTVSVFPNWFKTITINWWVNDLISDNEFKSIVTYLLDENIIPIELGEKPYRILGDFAPATKHLFNLWANDKLNEGQIISLVKYYRDLGIW